MRAIYEKYRNQKERPLRSCTSAKSLQKTSSKSSLKRQSSTPYFLSETKINRSKSPKSKSKKHLSMEQLDVNFKKFSSTCGEFTLKKSSLAAQKNKENSNTLKKKKLKNNFIK